MGAIGINKLSYYEFVYLHNRLLKQIFESERVGDYRFESQEMRSFYAVVYRQFRGCLIAYNISGCEFENVVFSHGYWLVYACRKHSFQTLIEMFSKCGLSDLEKHIMPDFIINH
jgi:hypothetical protein